MRGFSGRQVNLSKKFSRGFEVPSKFTGTLTCPRKKSTKIYRTVLGYPPANFDAPKSLDVYGETY